MGVHSDLRYAGNMIFFIKLGHNPQKLREKVINFLAHRGLSIKKTKTNLVKSRQGFDFLGWHSKLKAKNNKLVSYPSKDNRLQMIAQQQKTMTDTKRNEKLNKK